MGIRFTATVVVSSALVLAGCAKKREIPPRGTVLGSSFSATALSHRVQFSQATLERFTQTLKLDNAQHCLQLVQLNDEKASEVIELSNAACPTDDSLSSSVIATFQIWGAPESSTMVSYLVLGDAASMSDRTPVAVVRDNGNSAGRQLEISRVCEKADRMDLAQTCTLITSGSTLSRIDFNSSLSIARMNNQMGIVNLENFDTIQKQREALMVRLAETEHSLHEVEKRVGTAEGNAKNLLSGIQSIEKLIKDQQLALSELKNSKDFPEIQARLVDLRRQLKEVTRVANEVVFKQVEEGMRKAMADMNQLKVDSEAQQLALNKSNQEARESMKQLDADSALQQKDLSEKDKAARDALQKLKTDGEAVQNELSAKDKSAREALLKLKSDAETVQNEISAKEKASREALQKLGGDSELSEKGVQEKIKATQTAMQKLTEETQTWQGDVKNRLETSMKSIEDGIQEVRKQWEEQDVISKAAVDKLVKSLDTVKKDLEATKQDLNSESTQKRIDEIKSLLKQLNEANNPPKEEPKKEQQPEEKDGPGRE